MTRKSKLTPAEWQIMEAIWSLGGSPTVREVLEFTFPDGEKAYTTVQTVMNTLEKKNLLDRKKVGLVNFYKPKQTRDEMIKAEMSSFLTRVFDGSIPALANSLLALDDLNLNELEMIKKLLALKEKELKDKTS